MPTVSAASNDKQQQGSRKVERHSFSYRIVVPANRQKDFNAICLNQSGHCLDKAECGVVVVTFLAHLIKLQFDITVSRRTKFKTTQRINAFVKICCKIGHWEITKTNPI